MPECPGSGTALTEDVTLTRPGSERACPVCGAAVNVDVEGYERQTAIDMVRSDTEGVVSHYPTGVITRKLRIAAHPHGGPHA